MQTIDRLDELIVPAALHPVLQRARDLDPLYRYLKQHGVSQVWLASQLGMSKNNIMNYFRGLVTPPPLFLERACAVLDIPVAKMRVSTPATRRRVS